MFLTRDIARDPSGLTYVIECDVLEGDATTASIIRDSETDTMLEPIRMNVQFRNGTQVFELPEDENEAILRACHGSEDAASSSDAGIAPSVFTCEYRQNVGLNLTDIVIRLRERERRDGRGRERRAI